MRRLLLVALLSMTAGCASMAPRATPADIGYWGTATADIVSTQAALDRGAVELNSLMGESPSAAKMMIFKTAGYGLMRALENVLVGEIGEPLKWWQQFLVWLPAIGLQTWATINNHGVAR